MALFAGMCHLQLPECREPNGGLRPDTPAAPVLQRERHSASEAAEEGALRDRIGLVRHI